MPHAQHVPSNGDIDQQVERADIEAHSSSQHPAPSTIVDLSPSHVQQSSIKGGPGQGGILFNHNETLDELPSQPEATETPADLSPTPDDQQAVKGGPTSGIKLNHNETIADEPGPTDAADLETVAEDLAPSSQDQSAITGGPLSGIQLNHNQTLA